MISFARVMHNAVWAVFLLKQQGFSQVDAIAWYNAWREALTVDDVDEIIRDYFGEGD